MSLHLQNKPAPAQDEREAFKRALHSQKVFKLSSATIDAAEWAWFARPAQTEQQPAYVECRECTDCGHVGINDAHQTDATCAMCDWSGPSPVEDQCPDCGKENVMGAACPKCSGRYRILAETHVAAPIAQTEQQPASSALADVAAERRRQIAVEGWTPEHDDEHGRGEMALAAACYAYRHAIPELADVPAIWPWDEIWWKPGDPRRMLVKAAALILAEIERLDRAAARGGVQ